MDDSLLVACHQSRQVAKVLHATHYNRPRPVGHQCGPVELKRELGLKPAAFREIRRSRRGESEKQEGLESRRVRGYSGIGIDYKRQCWDRLLLSSFVHRKILTKGYVTDREDTL